MTAVAQNIDSAAYLPPPPSTSTPDAKGTSAAGKPSTDAPAANAQGAPSDFQSELELQQSGTQQTGKPQPESAGPPKTSPAKTGPEKIGPEKTGPEKTDSGKPGKKRNTPDGVNLAVVTPVQITEPQKQILPLALALAPPQELAQQQALAQQHELAQPQENAKLDDNVKLEEKATPDQLPVQQAGQAPLPSVAALAQIPELQQPAALKQSAKLRQSVQSPQASQNQIAASNATSATAADPGKLPVLPLAPVVSAIQDIPVRQEGKKSEDPALQDQAITPAKPGASTNAQPVSLTDLKLPAASAEPVASAVQETLDRASSGPSALAFAARMSTAQQKSDQAGAVNPSPSSCRLWLADIGRNPHAVCGHGSDYSKRDAKKRAGNARGWTQERHGL